MSRRRARAACLGSALLTVVLMASPALAANELGNREGRNPARACPPAARTCCSCSCPPAILLGVAALVWLPGMVKADRYRPQRGWSAVPVWFAGPPDPVAAVETAKVGTTARGGASGSW